MKHVMRLLASIVAGALSLAAVAATAGPPAAALAPLAHSADLAVDGAVAEGVLTLRVHRAGGDQALRVTDLAVRLDGRALPTAARADGSWAAPLTGSPAGARGRLQVLVAHDGTLEALDAELPASAAPAAPAAGGTLSALIHKQASWWILNVLIVLIGVIAISRRMS